VVFVATGGIEAYRASDGQRLWVAAGGFDGSELAVDGARVYADGACSVIAFDRFDGHVLWRTSNGGGCSGEDGTAALSGNRIFARSNGGIFDRASGARLGNVKASAPQMFARGLGISLFELEHGTFTARDAATDKLRWRRRVKKPQRYGPLVIAPVAVGHSVYWLEPSGRLQVLDLETGAPHGSIRFSPRHGVNTVYGELAVAPGLLLVPTQHRLTALESVYRPNERGIAFGLSLADVRYRERTYPQGVVGTGLRTKGARVRLEWSEFPYRRWHRNVTTPVQDDGFFAFVSRDDVNTRFRVRSGGAVSAVRTAYTWPRVSYKARRPAPNRIRLTIRMRTARRIRLAGRRATLYLGRGRTGSLTRLGSSTTLRGSGGGRGVGVVSFRALRHVGKRDFLTACVRGQARLGIGRANRFTRRCGARRIRF
jgi:hypothetical protein